MKLLSATFLLLAVWVTTGFAQDQTFSPAQLKSDLAFLKQQLYTVHVYPYTELDQARYDELFEGIDKKLNEPLTATAFLKLIKPAIAHLSDEHAQAYLPLASLTKSYRDEAVFLPVTLSRQGNNYRIQKVLSAESTLKPGEEITEIDSKPISKAIADCTLFTSGYPEQRMEKALQQFGYLYSWSLPGVQHTYLIKTNKGKSITVNGVDIKAWQAELNKQTGWESACDEQVSYQKINNAGYITACSFNIPQKQLDSIGNKIDLIFAQIQRDQPKYLFIDISKNSGGQSVVGRMLVEGFYSKPYKGFGSNFKKSQAYVDLLRSWKIEPDDYYKAAPEGKIFHFSSDTIFPPQAKPNVYKGKVYIIVGNGTFSSAMMMATWVKDNHMATIAGETPMLGHPNGFGELYNTHLPNTKIDLLFGVKQWIRPSGDLKDNLLRPDLPIRLTNSKEETIKKVLSSPAR